MKNLADEMFGTPMPMATVTAEDKAYGMLEDFFNNPYCVGKPMPKRLLVNHGGKLHIFDTKEIYNKYYK